MGIQMNTNQRPWRLTSSLLLASLALSCGGSEGRHRGDEEAAVDSMAQKQMQKQMQKQVLEAVVEVEAVKPGATAELNEGFEDEELDVSNFLVRFEGESREVFSQREQIVQALHLKPGEAVADIGSGTGFFSVLFAHEVGPKGRVFGVDISSKFIDHLGERAFSLGLGQIKTVLCTDRSAMLKDASIDAAFISDTYHHFEFPQDTLASLRSALRPGGRLMILDFNRIPGITRPWMLNHVRCGRDDVIAEVEAAGFVLTGSPTVAGLVENYVLVFERP
ncbi:MAG: SAM-dependent methyltransferase [Planctomycetota bacterium]|jgi:SAM-dependent methyltransferase